LEVYCHPSDIPLSDAMIVWTRGERVGVVSHPDYQGRSDAFQSSAGACFSNWREMDDQGRLRQFLIEIWHIAAFYGIPAVAVNQAAMCVPEFRNTLADDCLPNEYRHERG
jgi:hypothetical protein